MKISKCITIIQLFIVTFSFHLFPLDPGKHISQYVQNQWGIKDGLPQVSVHSIIRTKNGYLWLATEDGLVRFDGVDFKVYDKNSGNGKLKTNRITVLYEDQQQKLWIGTFAGGISYIDLNQDKFASGPSNWNIGEEIVYSFCEDYQGHILAGTDKGLYHIGDNVLSNNPLDRDFFNLNAKVNALYKTRKSGIWVGTDRELSRFEKGQLLDTYVIPDIEKNKAITALYEDSGGDLLVGTESGLFQIKNQRFIPFIYSQ